MIICITATNTGHILLMGNISGDVVKVCGGRKDEDVISWVIQC